MCFFTGLKRKPRFKIAKEDISVYKVINKDGTGQFYSMINKDGNIILWKKGFWYYQEDAPKSPSFTFQRSFREYTIHVGLHSSKMSIKEGYGLFHSTQKEVRMVIPQGAKYFENDDEYVSDQLIYY